MKAYGYYDEHEELMEYISCIEKKLKCVKEMIEDGVLDQKSKKKYNEDEDDYEYRGRMRGRFA